MHVTHPEQEKSSYKSEDGGRLCLSSSRKPSAEVLALRWGAVTAASQAAQLP